MTEKETLALINKIFQAIFAQDSPYTLDQLKTKFASDIQLPQLVKDSTTGEPTYSAMPNAKNYITDANLASGANPKAGFSPRETFMASRIFCKRGKKLITSLLNGHMIVITSLLAIQFITLKMFTTPPIVAAVKISSSVMELTTQNQLLLASVALELTFVCALMIPTLVPTLII